MIAWPLLLKLAAIGSWYPHARRLIRRSALANSRHFASSCSGVKKNGNSNCPAPRIITAYSKPDRLHGSSAIKCNVVCDICLGRCWCRRCVQLVLLPLMIVYFHRLSLASLLLNIVVSVLLAILVGVALVALLIAQVNPAVSAPLFKLADAINWLMVHSVDPFSGLNFRLPEYSGSWRGCMHFTIFRYYFWLSRSHTGARSHSPKTGTGSCSQ